MTTGACLSCDHWALKGSPLRPEGFGQCKADPNPVMREAKCTSPENVCRIGRFAPASERAVASRRKALGMDRHD